MDLKTELIKLAFSILVSLANAIQECLDTACGFGGAFWKALLVGVVVVRVLGFIVQYLGDRFFPKPA